MPSQTKNILTMLEIRVLGYSRTLAREAVWWPPYQSEIWYGGAMPI